MGGDGCKQQAPELGARRARDLGAEVRKLRAELDRLGAQQLVELECLRVSPRADTVPRLRRR